MSTKFIPSDSVLVAHLDGEAVLLDLHTKRYFRLNETAALVWASAEAAMTEASIIARLLETFDVSERDATDAVTTLFADLENRALVTRVC